MAQTTKKIAFLFPGQGGVPESPLVDFLGTSIEINYELFRAGEAPSLAEFYQSAIKSDLSAQLGVFALSLAMGLEAANYCTPDLISGYSSGLYGAMVASGCLKPEQGNHAIKLAYEGVCQADKDMVMVGVIGLGLDTVNDILQQLEPQGALSLVNNKTQVIATIKRAQLSIFEDECSEAGALKMIPLPFEYPYHIASLAPTSEMLGGYFKSIQLSPLYTPMVVGTRPEYLDASPERVAQLVALQLSQTVFWRETIQCLNHHGATTFVVFDPTGILTRIIRWISRKITVIGIENPRDLERLRDLT